MKQILLIMFVFSALLLSAVEKSEMPVSFKLTCFNGKLDSDSHYSTTVNLKRAVKPTKMNSGLTCGYPGHISKIKWEWKSEEANTLIFTRVFPADSTDPQTSQKEITYEGTRVILFEDQHQVITIGPEESDTQPGEAKQQL